MPAKIARLARFASAVIFLALASHGCQRPSDVPETRILFGGDVYAGESYLATRSQTGPSVVDRWGYRHSTEKMGALLRRSSFTLVNLEAPLAPQSETKGLEDKLYLHWSDASKFVPVLRAMGIDAVGLANNHSMDQGAAGLQQTLSSLASGGIATFGVGTTQQDASKPLIRAIPLAGGKMLNMAVFGMLEFRSEYDNQFQFYAKRGKPGVAVLDLKAFTRSVRSLRDQDKSTFVVAFPHWGRNYAWRTPEQRSQAHALVDAGADIVIGQHGHSLQEVERYRGKWIIYGVGNFMFNARGRYAKFKVLPYGAAVELAFAGSSKPEVRLFPIRSDNRVTNFQPQPVHAPEAEQILAALRARRGSVGLAARVAQYPAGAAIVLAR